jgi:hypothetical protein
MSEPYYSDDLVTLYHGDCREITEWLGADVLVTDPPYGIAWRVGGLHSLRSTWSTAEQSIAGDESVAVRDDVLSAWGTSRPAVMFGSWRQPRPPGTTHRLIWHKAGRKPGIAPAPWFPNDEEIYLIGSGWVGKSPRGTVLTTTEARERAPQEVGRPTPKPVGLMEALIERCSAGAIADPFAGSGATLLAARNLGRRAVGVELEERYCEVTARRLAQDTLFGGVA